MWQSVVQSKGYSKLLHGFISQIQSELVAYLYYIYSKGLLLLTIFILLCYVYRGHRERWCQLLHRFAVRNDGEIDTKLQIRFIPACIGI